MTINCNNARHLKVMMRHDGRTLLGDVRDAYHDSATGRCMLLVRHFNGELWPIVPSADDVEVI